MARSRVFLVCLLVFVACGDDDAADSGGIDAGMDARLDGQVPEDARVDACTTCSGECVDTNTDVEHCGGCALACANVENGTVACVSGECVPSCDDGFADCDGDASECEVSLTDDLEYCGACGTACVAPTGATAACIESACLSTCVAPLLDCDEVSSNGCEADPAGDSLHCGGCDVACAEAPNATPTCATSTCGIECVSVYLDCDASSANGCEVDSATDAANCGECGATCADARNAVGACLASTCGIECTSAFLDCDEVAGNGCEIDGNDDIDNCGACGNECLSGPNSSTSCAHSTCYFGCHGRYLDCDENPATGCEVDPQTTDDHCGACGQRCGSGQRCVAGACAGPRRVFITLGLIDMSDLNSLADGDAFCQAEADAESLPGTFYAWLSTDRGSPATRFTRSTDGYRRAFDGVVVASSWADLVDGNLSSGINRTLRGAVIPGTCSVLTNTRADGTAFVGQTCSNLTAAGPGWLGMPNRSNSDWTERCGPFDAACGEPRHLYCFEQ